MPKREEHPPYADRELLANALNDGELRVWDALRDNLSPEWEIYAQPHILDVMPDYVLLHPAKGVFIVEVKDVDLELKSSRQRANDVREARQKMRTTYRDALTNAQGASAPLTGTALGSCVIFARTTPAFADRLEADWRIGTPPIFAGEEMDTQMIAAIEATKITRGDPNDVLAACERLRHHLIEPEFVREQRQVPELSKMQRAIADNSDRVMRRVVKGGAGSGKTIALAARAAALSTNSDNRILVICFNRSLVTYLRDTIAMFVRSVGGDRKTITIRHWDGWWKDAREVLQVAFSGSVEDQGLAARNALDRDAAKRLPHYDAVLVDEAQDLTSDQIAALATVLKSSRSELLLCFDEAQDIYSKGSEWARGAFSQLDFCDTAVHLKESRRMPPRLAAIANGFAYKFLNVAKGDFLQVPDTETVGQHCDDLKWVQCEKWDLEATAMTEIGALFDESEQSRRDRVSWTDVVVATRTRDLAFAVSTELEHRGMPVLCAFAGEIGSPEDQNAKSHFYKGRGRLKVSTIKSLKGFETTAMIVVIDSIPMAGADAALREVYTAITRLKWREGGSSLTVVCAEPSLERCGKFFNHVSRNGA